MVNTRAVITYRLCLRCYRAVPASSPERHCINDGEQLLEACPRCGSTITSPYARHCGACGQSFEQQPVERKSP